MTPVAVCGISYRHGAWCGLEDLVDRGQLSSDGARQLQLGGLTRFSRITDPVAGYYRDCVEETLARAELEPTQVDAVIFFSSTFSAYDDYDDVALLSAATGIRCALPMGLFLGQCTNFSAALTVARGLITTEGFRNVLLLGADALDESRASRILPGSLSVFSDAVLTCIVTADQVDGQFRLEHVRHRYDPELQALDPQRDLLRYIDRFTRALGGACRDVLQAGGLEAAGVDHLVLANLTVPTLKNFAAVAGVPFSRVHTDGVSRFAHCFSYDQLISLHEMREAKDVSAGQHLLLLGVGGNYLFSAVTMTLHDSGDGGERGSDR